MLLALGIIVWIVLAVFALRGARWAYAIFLVLAFVWIPGSGGFRFHHAECDRSFSLDLALYSLTNYKHIVLFGMFFLMTRVQLGRTPHALLIAAAATLAMGLLIEVEEGLTVGHCRIRDLVPDSAGALIGAVIWTLWSRRRR